MLFSVALNSAEALVIVRRLLFPDALSLALTIRMPLPSTSKVTLIWGTPHGAGGMPLSSNRPSSLLSRVRERSPSYTWKPYGGRSNLVRASNN